MFNETPSIEDPAQARVPGQLSSDFSQLLLPAVLHRWFLPDIPCIFPVIMTAANLMNLCALPRFLL